MKIAMFTNNYKPYTGGVPVSIERLSMGLRRQGHEVFIFAPSYGDNVLSDFEDDYVIRYASYKKRLDGGFVIPKSSDPLIKKELKRINPDIIHTHHPMLIGSRAVELGARYSIPVVYTYHTRYEDYLHYIGFYRKIEELGEKRGSIAGKAAEKIDILSKRKLLTAYMRSFIKKCDLVFSPSLLTERIVDNLKTGVPQVLLATGIEDRFYCDSREKGDLREKLSGGKSMIFCTVTRLSKEKNIEFILKSLQVFKKKFSDDFKYVLIGDGPERGELETMANDLGISDNVYFAGNVDNSEVHKYYNACDIFLFASKSETQGIVLLEAMASSMPVVAVNAGGVEDVVKNGRNGFMTSENEYDFANKLYITAANNTVDRRYSRGARETADMYTVNKMAQKAQEGYYTAILEKEAKMSVARRHTA